jgi:hypothetical protein
MKITYDVDNGGPCEVDVKCKPPLDAYDKECIAKLCAEHYYREHDGWDGEWPVDMEIQFYLGTDPERYTVELEAVPTFSARLA